MVYSMVDRQPGSQFWGTGTELSALRDTLDPIAARDFIAVLGNRLFPGVYDYSLVEFRGLNLPVQLRIIATGERIEITPYWHLASEDGRGNHL